MWYFAVHGNIQLINIYIIMVDLHEACNRLTKFSLVINQPTLFLSTFGISIVNMQKGMKSNFITTRHVLI